jgi:hypothetical protein
MPARVRSTLLSDRGPDVRIVQLIAVGEPLDHHDLAPPRRDRQREAGERAGRRPAPCTPARPLITALLAAGEIEVVAQRVQRADARLEFDDVPSDVDLERHWAARWAYDGATGLDKCHGTASFMAGRLCSLPSHGASGPARLSNASSMRLPCPFGMRARAAFRLVRT